MNTLARWAMMVRTIIRTEDLDWIHVVTGREGIGKTSLAASLCEAVDKDFNIVDDAIFSTKQLIERVSVIRDKMVSGKKYAGKALLIDEGALVFLARDSMGRANKEAIRLMTTIRAFNMFIVICVPNFWILDRYIREHRVKTVSRVMSRGWCWFYSPVKVRMFKCDKSKHYKGIYPQWDFRDTFPDYALLYPGLWAKYKEKKAKETVKERSGTEPKGPPNTRCGTCRHEWEYRGKRNHSNCPNCGRLLKTKNLLKTRETK